MHRKNLDSVFSALSNETRRAILGQLMAGEIKLSELAEPFNMTQTAVSKHISVLGQAGLVTVEKRGRSRHCRLNAAMMKEASEWFSNYESFWTEQFDNLSNHLVEKK